MSLAWRATPLLHDFLHHSAERFPDKVALVAQGQRVTYAELEQRSNALAHTLVARGVTRQDRVHLYAENSVEAVVSWWAVLKANAVPTVLNPLTRTEKLAYYLNDARATVLIADAQLTPQWAPAAAKSKHLKAIIVVGNVDAERTRDLPVLTWAEAIEGNRAAPPNRSNLDVDLAAIIYTSGSTGEPKGVMLTHRNMLTASTSLTTLLEMNSDEVVLSGLPLAFNYGLYQTILTFLVGGRLVLERGYAFPIKVMERFLEEKVTGFPGVPTIFALLAELKILERWDFSSVRFITNTAAALPLKHIEMMGRVFPKARIYSMYGLTECKRCSWLPPEDVLRKPNSVGIALPNTEFWLVDENDHRLGPNQVGQLVIRGANVMRGYWEKPEATAERLRPGPLAGEQVFYTGDLCRTDDDGYLYFVARMDDIIKSRGEKVAPKEVENALIDVPGVKEAAVIGTPDEVLGEAIKAFVVLEAGVSFTEKELQREVQKRLESFMVPKQIVLVDALPKTDTGKIKKIDLK